MQISLIVCYSVTFFFFFYFFLSTKSPTVRSSFLCFTLVLGLSVHSEMDLRSSTSPSSVPNLPHQACHLFPTSLKPSLSSLCTAPTHLPDLSGSCQPSRPTHYAFTVPAFTRAHPPALPKIFQPTAGSGTHLHEAGAVIKQHHRGVLLTGSGMHSIHSSHAILGNILFHTNWVFTMVLMVRLEWRNIAVTKLEPQLLDTVVR